ncbi:unnamed protein product [Paramecium octaurelia]|uniref:Uncharacterized protein n=1 Tax=Paramecium octaurelia TaxID=43137 RepID=A0A8S1XFN3_PAROT|nr:unnamed protein product [Paramecium octaurelia]
MLHQYNLFENQTIQSEKYTRTQIYQYKHSTQSKSLLEFAQPDLPINYHTFCIIVETSFPKLAFLKTALNRKISTMTLLLRRLQSYQ